MYWLHMHTVQRSNMPKEITTKIACGTGKGLEVVPHYWANLQHVSFLYQGCGITHDIHNPTALVELCG
eukprot:517726-Ditylum_brightwellii.AAC.1